MVSVGLDSLPSTEELQAIPDLARSGIGNVLDEAWKRVVAVGTAIAALISAVLVGNLSLVSTITAIPGTIWAFIASIPGAVWAFLASIPGFIWGATTAGASAGTGWVMSVLNSWGMSILATGVAVIANRPWIAGVLVLGGIAAWVGPDGFRDDFKAVIQYLLLSVLGYVGALTLGDGLLQNVSILVVQP